MPYHPIAAHIPLGLAFVMPVVLIIIFVGIQNSTLDMRAWGLVILLHGFMFLGAVITRQMGLNDADLVAKVSPQIEIQKHETRANIFVGATLLVTALSVLVVFGEHKGKGKLLRILTIVASVLAVVAGVAASHSGGELVYFFDAIKAWSLSK